MSLTSRELVLRTLNFEDPPRAPRQLWQLPIAKIEHPAEYQDIVDHFQPDFQGIAGHQRESAPVRGNPYQKGIYVDEWGCTFTNIHEGVHGEIKEPLVRDWAKDAEKIHIPVEWLTIDREAVNRDCGATDRFTMAGSPRPFERLQFLRGSAELFMDLADPSKEFLAFMRRMHEFYTQFLTAWARTDIDGLGIMDDWGSQRSLLISPRLWREHFKPMYRDYAQIAHGAGKKVFMHSDGYILDIFEDLAEIGIDALNSQIFCMGIENVAKYAGRITFWGEMDRQHLLVKGTPDEIDAAVRKVHRHLWKKGGCIAQCEYGPAARPENIRQVFLSWDRIFETH
jgi:hypothetical protein